jgi:WD40 repeat protein
MEGTRQSLLEDITGWLDDFTAPNILLLSGSPGAGKSTITATVVSKLDNQQRLGSSFAFQHDDSSLSDPVAVWRTVASDLARFSPGVRRTLVEILKGVDPGKTDIDQQFRRLIEGPLIKNLDELSYNPPVVVLDALDECDSDRSRSDHRKRLLGTLTKWRSLPQVFKLIVTSRDERLPNSFRQVCKPVTLHTGSRVTAGTSDDITLFFRTRFADISEQYPSLSSWPGESTIERLTRRAAGLFIWAETLIRFVGNEQGAPDDQLDLVFCGDFGEEGDIMTRLYRRILDVSFGCSNQALLNASCAIVGIIVLAKIPLHRDDLAAFLPIPVKESIIDLILNKLSSVISIGQTDRIIHICHLSFVDFICDATQSLKHAIDRVVHNWSFASACFRLMNASLKFNICDLETSHLSNDDVPDLPARVQISIPSRLSYACQFGMHHLRDAPHTGSSSTELLNDVDYFFHVQFLYWLEVMSLVKKVPMALAALFTTTRWIPVSLLFLKVANSDLITGLQPSHPDLAAFAADAARFVVNFADPISTSAPHIYLSALPWSPRRSRVAQHFLAEFPRTLSIHSGQEDDWPATVNILLGHSGSVTSVGFSPDGKRIVSGSEDKTIRIWDAETGEEVSAPFEGHTDSITSVMFSPDGKRIVSGSYDKTIRMWNPETGEEIAGPFVDHTHGIACVAFSSDGTRIVSGSCDKTIRIWDTKTGHAVARPLVGHKHPITSVRFSPNGKLVASGSYENTIVIWDAQTGEQVARPHAGHNDCFRSVDFSPDGQHIVAGSDDSTIRIWDVETGGKVAGPFEGHTAWITSVKFSHDGRRIVSGGYDETVRIWDADTGNAKGVFEGHMDVVTYVEFSPDGKRVVSASRDGTICIWDAVTSERLPGPRKSQLSSVTSVRFSPEGKRIVSGSDDATIHVWDVETGEEVANSFAGHTEFVTSVGFSPDGKHIVSGSHDKTVRVWDAETCEVTGIFDGHTDWVLSVEFSPDGLRIVSGSDRDDNTIRMWNAKTGKEVAGPFTGHTETVTSTSFSLDGKRVVSGSADRTIRIWDAETGAETTSPLEGHTDLVRSVRFSPNGKYVVSGSADNTVRVWDVDTGEEVVGPFEGHTHAVTSVGFSPDGNRIVSASGDNTIRIWDVKTGKEIAGPFRGHAHVITSVGFSPDGNRVFSGSYDRTIRIWDAEIGGGVVKSSENHGRSITSSIRFQEVETDGKSIRHLRKFHHCHYFRGWMKTDDGRGLLFWVPVSHRGHVCGTDTIAILGASMTKLDLSVFAHGLHWVSCCRSTRTEPSGSSPRGQ